MKLGRLAIGANANLAFLMVLHVLSFSGGAVIVKGSGSSIGIAQLIFCRSIFVLGLLAAHREARLQFVASLQSNARTVLTLRAVAGFLGMYGAYYATVNLPVPVALTVTGITPIAVALLESLLLGNTVPRKIYLYAMLACVGIYFATCHVCSPAPRTVTALGVAVGLISGVLAAVSFIAIRLASQQVGTHAIVIWFGLGNLIGSACIGGANLPISQYSALQALCIAAVCILGFVSDLAKTKAYGVSRAWVISLLSLFAIPSSGMLGHLFLRESLTSAQIAGMTLMLAAIAAALHRRT